MDRVRMDKWLWAARFYKTRALAAHACEMGRVQCAGANCKAARDVRPGDMVRVKNDGGEFEIEVLELSDMRGPAAVAQKLYRETDASRTARAKAIEDRKNMPWIDVLCEGRPSKRDRRQFDRLRGR
jgi:ribosome-associated heat shock protein Hsp15